MLDNYKKAFRKLIISNIGVGTRFVKEGYWFTYIFATNIKLCEPVASNLWYDYCNINGCIKEDNCSVECQIQILAFHFKNANNLCFHNKDVYKQ